MGSYLKHVALYPCLTSKIQVRAELSSDERGCLCGQQIVRPHITYPSTYFYIGIRVLGCRIHCDTQPSGSVFAVPTTMLESSTLWGCGIWGFENFRR